MKHRPCEKHDDCTRPDGHAGECVSGLELLRRPTDDATRLCPQCGATATRARVVPAFSCASCGCLFRPA